MKSLLFFIYLASQMQAQSQIPYGYSGQSSDGFAFPLQFSLSNRTKSLTVHLDKRANVSSSINMFGRSNDDYTLEMISPWGTHHAMTKDPSAVESSYFAFSRQQTSGAWTLQATWNPRPLQLSSELNFGVHISEPKYEGVVFVPARPVYLGERIPIMVRIMNLEAKATETVPMVVTGFLQGPVNASGLRGEIPLEFKDDGTDPGGLSGDGQYGAWFEVQFKGDYFIGVRIEAQIEGSTLYRTPTHHFSAIKRGARIKPGFTETAIVGFPGATTAPTAVPPAAAPNAKREAPQVKRNAPKTKNTRGKDAVPITELKPADTEQDADTTKIQSVRMGKAPKKELPR